MSSPIEKVFKEIFGSLPAKSGTAYEQLAAIAMHLLHEGGVAQHDARIRGQFSESVYQLDVHHQDSDGKTTMAEAKDYSALGRKVGRGDLQKLGGALPDINEVHAGAFFSATGYTKPAKQYANAAGDITGGKEINLYELGISTEEDEKGFVKTVVINVEAIIPHVKSGEFRAVFTPQGEAALKEKLLVEGKSSISFSYELKDFYDEMGSICLSLETLTSMGYGEINSDSNCAFGCFWLPNHQVRICDILVPINGVEYKIPFTIHHRKICITDDSEHRFVVRDEKGTALLLLTDNNIREYSFDACGNVYKHLQNTPTGSRA